MQKEMTELYKKHKVNPIGGCLPMLLQIPVFFALYTILSVAVELRGAPFILWITDLAGLDTLFGHIPSWFPRLAVSLWAAADCHGDYNGHPAEDDAIVSRPCPAEDDDAHANYIYIYVS